MDLDLFNNVRIYHFKCFASLKQHSVENNEILTKSDFKEMFELVDEKIYDVLETSFQTSSS